MFDDCKSDRALLLVWPNNADYADNPHLVHADKTSKLPVRDADFLAAYLVAGGETVIYAGERQKGIAGGDDNGKAGENDERSDAADRPRYPDDRGQ